ncbi:MAG: hypothetical protein ACQEQ4_07670 [Fibrobacterota bacterium]
MAKNAVILLLLPGLLAAGFSVSSVTGNTALKDPVTGSVLQDSTGLSTARIETGPAGRALVYSQGLSILTDPETKLYISRETPRESVIILHRGGVYIHSPEEDILLHSFNREITLQGTGYIQHRDSALYAAVTTGLTTIYDPRVNHQTFLPRGYRYTSSNGKKSFFPDRQLHTQFCAVAGQKYGYFFDCPLDEVSLPQKEEETPHERHRTLIFQETENETNRNIFQDTRYIRTVSTEILGKYSLIPDIHFQRKKSYTTPYRIQKQTLSPVYIVEFSIHPHIHRDDAFCISIQVYDSRENTYTHAKRYLDTRNTRSISRQTWEEILRDLAENPLL